jgi:MoxR-like ATPase
MFESIDQTVEAFADYKYICDRKVATVSFLASRMQKPILIEGPAGVGKTELAKVTAGALSRPLLRLQCYGGLDETRALYEWEYAKQLLYTQILRDKISQLFTDITDLRHAVDVVKGHEDLFFSEDFIVARPILQAIRAAEPVVLLIDEIDRAEEHFEAFLLEVLSDFQVTVPELGTITAAHPPTVILTSNNTRDLSDALKRRCLHLFIDYPDEPRELEIVRLKVPDISTTLASQVVDVVRRLRALDLRKAPSISETLDWAQSLVLLDAEHLTHELFDETLQLLVKFERDTRRVEEHRDWLLETRGRRESGHAHAHGDQHHRHHHDQRHGDPVSSRSGADSRRHGEGEPASEERSKPIRPPLRTAEPELRDVEQRQREHSARYFGSYRGRVDGSVGDP